MIQKNSKEVKSQVKVLVHPLICT